ncbi:MAG: alcohol dehydrogenase catalytic domain-containing protein [Actinomycetota bacterium]|nr:alcohol dehydrogenase catalytic domain-containing protein [Actinomycetota bacterium]
MRAVRTVDGAFDVVEAPEPSGDGVLIDVVAAGICGSDLHMAGFGLPTTVGHEVAGRTADGAAVAVRPTLTCGSCDRCLAGEVQQCRDMGLYGLVHDGGMADRILVHPTCVVPLPDDLPVADACLVEPVAVSFHAVATVGVEPGHRVLVVGGGSIGLTAVAAARAVGADVDLSARHDHQRTAGERLGAGVDPSGESDVVVEAAGTQSAVVTAIDHARPGGTVSMVGVYWDGLALPNVMTMFLKEVRLVPSSTYGCARGPHLHGLAAGGSVEGDPAGEMVVAAHLLADIPDLADALVTHRFGLDEAVEAFRVATDRSAGAIKVVLEP